MEVAGASRPGPELPVDVPDMGSRDDRELETELAELLDQRAEPRGVRLPVRNGRAVPVEDDRLEASIERSRANTIALDCQRRPAHWYRSASAGRIREARIAGASVAASATR